MKEDKPNERVENLLKDNAAFKELLVNVVEGLYTSLPRISMYQGIIESIRQKELPNSYERTDQAIESENELESILGSIPDSAHGKLFSFVNFLMSTFFLLSERRTYNGVLKRQISDGEERIKKYQTEIDRIRKEKKTISESLENKANGLEANIVEASKPVLTVDPKTLEEYMKTSDELIYLYHNLIRTNENYIRSKKAVYDMFFSRKPKNPPE